MSEDVLSTTNLVDESIDEGVDRSKTCRRDSDAVEAAVSALTYEVAAMEGEVPVGDVLARLAALAPTCAQAESVISILRRKTGLIKSALMDDFRRLRREAREQGRREHREKLAAPGWPVGFVVDDSGVYSLDRDE